MTDTTEIIDPSRVDADVSRCDGEIAAVKSDDRRTTITVKAATFAFQGEGYLLQAYISHEPHGTPDEYPDEEAVITGEEVYDAIAEWLDEYG